MDKDDFRNTNEEEGWWLTWADDDLGGSSSEVATERAKIKDLAGLETDWWRTPAELEKLYDALNASASLLDDPDQLLTESERVAWLKDVVEALAPEDEDEAPEQLDEATQGTTDAAQAAAPDQLDADAESPATEAEQPPVGDGQPEAEEAGEDAAPAEAPQQQSAEGEWSADWGMFTRFKDGKYEYALSSALADTPGTAAASGTPGDTWYDSAEAAGIARNAAIQVGQHLANLDLPEETLAALQTEPGVREDIEAEMADLEAELAGLEAEEPEEEEV